MIKWEGCKVFITMCECYPQNLEREVIVSLEDAIYVQVRSCYAIVIYLNNTGCMVLDIVTWFDDIYVIGLRYCHMVFDDIVV